MRRDVYIENDSGGFSVLAADAVDTLAAAVAFVRDFAIHGRLTIRPGPEHAAFDEAARVFSPEEGSLAWEGDVVRLTDPDDRTMILLATKVFRLRFGTAWPVDADDDDDDDDDA